ncbi:MAG TPA: InlB B-repeat-containing protein, partial [Acidimicrobiales bacterium]|nr:InlB B-repeat-containing protein [Acidimicrobiales bacterium]
MDLAPGTYEPASDTSFTIPTSITVQPTTPGSTATLEGNGAGVLGVNSSVTATVSGVSIEDGAAATDGGGIANSGTLTVEDSTISGNAAQYAGGGIANSGTLTVEDSTISGNNAGGGGGIYNSGTLTVEDSTIFGNTAIACLNGADSTGQPCVAPVDGGGGGIYNQGTATIEASTITDNSVATGYEGTFGGGINNSADSSMTLAADIIADQSSGGDCSNDVDTVTDAGYNIDDDGTCGLSGSNNSIPDSTVLDDYLGTLGPNGGPTETVPLLATPSTTTSSADPAFAVVPSTFDLPIAVNGVALACSIPDQRGVTPDQPCDIGAFSLAIDTVAFVANGGGTVASITGPDGSSITLPSDTYPGYTFNGWYAAASGGTEVAGASASYVIPVGGVTLYAQWTPIATDDYSFNAAGGAPTPASASGLDGTTITLPGAPTLSGYAFAGWNDGTTTYGAGATYTLSSGGSPIVFTAQWGANATDAFSFNTAGGSPTPAPS